MIQQRLGGEATSWHWQLTAARGALLRIVRTSIIDIVIQSNKNNVVGKRSTQRGLMQHTMFY